jgi:hypothetical protein
MCLLLRVRLKPLFYHKQLMDMIGWGQPSQPAYECGKSVKKELDNNNFVM